jgi:tRNA dimethylallyltransferase
MQTKSKPIVEVVAGPTASGKTDFAVKLAKQINGELINVDSRQIYKYLDIGTNKGKLKNLNQDLRFKNKTLPVHEVEGNGIKIHLLSFLEPDKPFSAFAFRELTYEAIEYILKLGKVPILVGGSGLYLEVIMHPEKYSEQVTTNNEQLRAELNKLSRPELQKRVQEIGHGSWEKLNESDRENPRRLIRIIEKAAENFEESPQVESPYEFHVHLLEVPMSELTERINKRVEEMFAQGIVKETKRVLDMGFPPTSVALQGIGYREILKLLKGEISGKQCISLVQIAHRKYAKRQVTWFKKYLRQEAAGIRQ